MPAPPRAVARPDAPSAGPLGAHAVGPRATARLHRGRPAVSRSLARLRTPVDGPDSVSRIALPRWYSLSADREGWSNAKVPWRPGTCDGTALPDVPNPAGNPPLRLPAGVARPVHE